MKRKMFSKALSISVAVVLVIAGGMTYTPTLDYCTTSTSQSTVSAPYGISPNGETMLPPKVWPK